MIVRSAKRTLGLIAPALAVSPAVFMVGIAYGATASAAGLPGWLVVLAAVLILGASSELVFVGVIAAGGLPFIAAAAALVINLRNMIYGFSASSFLPRRRLTRAVSAHLVNDESVAFALAQKDPAERLFAFRLVGMAILIAWPLGATAGVLLGFVVPDPGRLGLDAAFPAIFFAILFGSIKRSTAAPATVGAAVAVAATPFVAAGLAPVLGLTGLVTLLGKRKSRA